MNIKDSIMPVRRAERKKRKLLKLLRDTQRNKAALAKAVDGLYSQYVKGLITHEIYQLRLNAVLGTRTIEEWSELYDVYAQNCVEKIDDVESEIKGLKLKHHEYNFPTAVPYLLLAALVIFVGFMVINPAFTGFVALEKVINASDSVNMSFNESGTYVWHLSRPGELRSLAMSGQVSSEGAAVVSILNDGNAYVIFNSSERGLDIGSITGFATYSSSENRTAPEPVVVEEGDKKIKIDMQYKPGTTFDPKDNGVESTGGYIDFTVEDTKTKYDESHLCTVWSINNEYQECYGSGLCCNFVEADRYGEDWKTSFIMYYGLEGTKLENNITSQVWHVDYNLSLDNPYSEIYSSDRMQLPASFYMRGYSFEDACEDTCLVSGFNSSNYTLVIELDNAEIDIASLDYTVEIDEYGANETLVQHTAEINKPVKWTKVKKHDVIQDKISVNISENAENITVHHKKSKKDKPKNLKESKLEKQQKKDIIKDKDYVELTIDEPGEQVEIEYFTPAPTAVEEVISSKEKKVIVSAEEHYTDILTYTSLPSEASAESIHLYWLVNNSRTEVQDITKNDTNDNGLIDWIEWITPSLSNQTFVIEITEEGEFNWSSGTFNGTARDGENITLDGSLDSYTKLLLHADGDDSSSEHTFENNGDVILNSSDGKFGGSLYLDGTGDYLSLGDSDDWDLGNDDFTIESWVRFNSLDGNPVITAHYTNDTERWHFFYNSNGNLKFWSYIGGTQYEVLSDSWTPSLGTWYHVACVRKENTISFFVDGKEKGDGSYTQTIPDMTDVLSIGARQVGGSFGQYFNGSIDELKISKGLARYDSNFTPDTTPYEADDNTTLLLHFEGDESGSQHPVKFEGDTKLNATEGKFSGSFYFDGSGDYLSVPDSEDWNFGSGDFTIDGWIKVKDNTDYFAIYTWYESSSTFTTFWYNKDGPYLQFMQKESGSNTIFLSSDSWTPTNNEWYHVSVVKEGNDYYFHVDGENIGSGNDNSAISDLSGNVYIGARSPTEYTANGYIDELRISKGIARWNSNFTPDTSPYSGQYPTSGDYVSEVYDAGSPINWGSLEWEEPQPYRENLPDNKDSSEINMSGNILLMHMDETAGTNVEDTSGEGNNGTIHGGGIDSYTKLVLHMDDAGLSDSSNSSHDTTLNGDVARNSGQSKFGGYSAYFDGNGDYLNVSDSSDWEFGTGDFTIDGWIRFSSKGGSVMSWAGQVINSTERWYFGMHDTHGAQFYSRNGDDDINIFQGSGTTSSWNNGQWYHVALVRNGNNWNIYRDGTSVASGTDSDPVVNPSAPLDTGYYNGGGYFNGYIDELRISKGIARWTSNFTPGSYAYDYESHAGGRLGSGLDLDGVKDYVDTNLNASTLSNTTTFSLWMKPKSTGRQTILSGHTSSPNRWDLEYDNGGDKKIMWVEHDDENYIYSENSVPLDEWAHLAVIHDFTNKNLEIYINGELDSEHFINRSLKTPVDIGIGRRTIQTNFPFNASFDEVAVWNRSLTQSEIEKVYAAGALSLNISARDCDDDSCSGETAWDIECSTSPCDISSLPASRYLQYRASFTTENTEFTPYLESVNITYGRELPEYSNFASTETTNFSAESSLGNVSNMTLAVDATKAIWTNDVNATAKDYDANIKMDEGFISINVPALDSTINTSANITIENVDCNDFDLYYAEGFHTSVMDLVESGTLIATENSVGSDCVDSSICTDVYCSANKLNFIAQHFDGFGVGTIKWVNATPSTVGYNGNVTIDTEIQLGNYTIDEVFVGITPPGEPEANYTMTNISATIYAYYNYTNTTNGTYNYKVYVNNTDGNLTSESGTFFMQPNNTAPTHSEPVLNATDHPLNRTSANLTCHNQSTSDSDPVTNVYRWFRDNVEQPALENSSVVESNNTAKGEEWICEVTPYDGELSGPPLNSSAITILNSPPPKVVLVSPANNATGFVLKPEFNWSESVDPDGDAVTYRLSMQRISCDGLSRCQNPEITVEGIEDLHYTLTEELDVDSPYNWTITANDSSGYGEESDERNYTVASLVDISFVVENISVGGLEPGDNESTEDDSPLPFLIQNNGNVHLNLTVNATSPLWELAPLGTRYLQFRAGENSTKPGSFNMGLSSSGWLNMSGTQQHVIANLNYNATHDYAELELKAEVPQTEPPGLKSTTIIMEAFGTVP